MIWKFSRKAPKPALGEGDVKYSNLEKGARNHVQWAFIAEAGDRNPRNQAYYV